MALDVLNYLTPLQINIQHVFLDPNNPRSESNQPRVLSNRITNIEVQNRALSRNLSYEVNQLKESIKNVGLLPIDNIVVVKVFERSDSYVVIEGNRRISAVKLLLMDIESGLEVNELVYNSLQNINVLCLENQTYDTSLEHQLLIQGIRHLSGVKGWEPYQQAKVLVNLVDLSKGFNITRAAQTVGLGRTKAAILRKAYHAFEQMKNNEYVDIDTIGDDINNYFSYFVELIKDPNLRARFQWSDINNRFENETEVVKFYTWIGLIENEEGQLTRRISGALAVRKLEEVLTHPEASRLFLNGATIEVAHATTIAVETAVDYENILQDVYNKLNNLPATFIRNMSIEQRNLLRSIYDVVEGHLR